MGFRMCLLLGVLALFWCPQALAKDKLAVMDLIPKHGVEGSLAAALSDFIRDQIQSHGDYEVLSKGDIEALAERTEIVQKLGSDDTEYLIDLGRELNTRFMVAGSISKLGAYYAVHLRLLDTTGEDPGVRKRMNEQCECSEGELISMVTDLADRLMGKEPATAPVPRPVEAGPPGGKAVPVLGRAAKVVVDRIAGVEFEFAYISPGTFVMGSPPDELGRDNDEAQHRVTLAKAFYLQTTEVTQAQWQSVMGSNPSYFKNCGRNCPVEQVSWNDCLEFIRELNRLAGANRYRFPTEAEWEYAARAGTTTALYNGDNSLSGKLNVRALDEIAWYGGNSCVSYSGGYDCLDWDEKQVACPSCGTHAVKGKAPNAWGLYDMIGNVWEWCQDRYGEYPRGAVDDPVGPLSGTDVILRGGAFDHRSRFSRSAGRGFDLPETRFNAVGFRLARSVQ